MIMWTERDTEFCWQIIDRWRSSHYDALEIKCFNKEEAEAIREFVMRIEPKAKLYMSWLVFPKRIASKLPVGHQWKRPQYSGAEPAP